MKTCQVDGCQQKLSNDKHNLCLDHWRMDREGALERVGANRYRVITDTSTPDEPTTSSEWLSSTRLGSHFGMSAAKMNLLLSELGWIEKYVKGWVPTDRGNSVGAQVREARQSGVPYVVWPSSILDNGSLIDSVADITGTEKKVTSQSTSAPTPTKVTDDFREKFPCEFRATDGHMVRSRAEMLIDNWLYMQGLVHAFERKLPIEETVYCDFYLPSGKVYIEYWGLEDDPRYAARKLTKQSIYKKYNLNLVELTDDDIMNLDDVLPRMLLKFGVDCT